MDVCKLCKVSFDAGILSINVRQDNSRTTCRVSHRRLFRRCSLTHGRTPTKEHTWYWLSSGHGSRSKFRCCWKHTGLSKFSYSSRSDDMAEYRSAAVPRVLCKILGLRHADSSVIAIWRERHASSRNHCWKGCRQHHAHLQH